jgi:hypothetical protein
MFLWSRGRGTRVRTVASGEVKEERTDQAQREGHTCHLSSWSRRTDAIPFGDVAQVDLHRADAVRLLDCPPAAEHLRLLLEAVPQAGVTFPATVLDRS